MKTKSVSLLALAILLPLSGCAGNVHVTSDPPGAIVYQSSGLGPFAGRWDPNDTADVRIRAHSLWIGRRQQDALKRLAARRIGARGQTPTTYRRFWQVEAAKVVWPDGTESDVKHSERSHWGSEDVGFHFVKPTVDPKAPKSTAADFAHKQTVPADTEPSREVAQRWAVVIGINRYRDRRIPALATAEADAEKMAATISGRIGLTRDHIKVLKGTDATQQSIRSALGTWLARKATKDDLVLIFYAGHGAPETDYSKKSPDGYAKYLVPYDAKADDLFATAIPMTEIATIFDRIEAQRIIFFSDACYSGAAGGRSFSIGKFRGVRIGDPTAALASGKGRVIITAGDANEPAVEDKKLGHGVFTYYLLEGLSGRAADTNGKVTLQGLYKYVSDRVTRKSKELGGNQHPIMKGEIRGDIILVPGKGKKKAGSK